MHIDHTKQLENITSKTLQETSKNTAAEVGKTGQSILEFGKAKETYRMTDGGSFFMPNAVYQKPDAKEEETVLDQLDSQMDMTAANRRNQMIVVSNTASPQDLEEMSKDGFSAMDADSHTIVTVTDKIKAVLAKAGVDISIYGDDLSMEELEKATGSSAVARQIASALKQADLPTSQINLEESEKAYYAAEELVPLTDASKEYLLKNGWEPTIQNLYKASHSGVTTHHMPEVDFQGIEKQVEKIIKDAGFSVSQEMKENCKWLIQKEIPLTINNLKYLNSLNTLSNQITKDMGNGIDMSQVVARMAEAIQEGRRPMDALLVDGFSYEDRAKAAMETVFAAEDGDVAYCLENQLTLSVENLQVAMANRKEQSATVSIEMSESLTFITAKRQLEETRLLMTTQANYALLKRGISIDTKPLEQVVENLKNLENQYSKDLMNQSGIAATEENISLFQTTTKYVEELRFQPAYVLDLHSAKDSIRTLHEAGSALKNAMDMALQSYETLWTAPRKDMGDSIQKAFGNIDEILKDLDLEVSEANQRAVRILAHNSQPLTVENIAEIKDVDLEMQRLFRNLTPAATLELIRKGENPLDIEISQLNEMVESMQAESGEKENERFSKFLWKLEQNNEISKEERDSYIGIYRLIAQVEKNDGAALGALLNQGADITMRNLLTATRSARKEINYSIDDNFEGVTPFTKGPRIDDQIQSSYQTKCLKEAGHMLSPEKLAQMEEWENMTPEQFMEELQKVQQQEVVAQESQALEQQYYTELAQEYQGVLEASDDVYAFLEKYDMKNSANHVLAASRLLQNPSNAFDTLFATSGKSADYQEMIAELKAQVLENFGEAIKTPEEMGKAQATLAEVATRVMQTMIIENETVSVKDLKDLRLMCQQFQLCNQKAKEESYLVPVETGDTVTGVNLKIVRGKADKGLVDIFFRGALMEKVAASFEAKEGGVSGVIATTDQETQKFLAENLRLFAERINPNGEEPLDIQVAYVQDLSAWQFEKNALPEKGEASPVQTKRLYHIAESFIQTVSELM